MKKKFIVPAGLAIVIGGAAFGVVAMSGKPDAVTDWAAMRGTESYYLPEEKEFEITEVLANVMDGDGAMFRGNVTLIYQLGPELPEAESIFRRKTTLLRDRLVMIFSSRPRKELLSYEHKVAIKKSIEREFESLVFPDKKGRIRDVLFPLYVIQ